MNITKRAWELLRERATHSQLSIGQAKKLWWADCMQKAYKEAQPRQTETKQQTVLEDYLENYIENEKKRWVSMGGIVTESILIRFRRNAEFALENLVEYSTQGTFTIGIGRGNVSLVKCVA